MNIIYLTPSGQLGGAEIALLDLMASIRDAQPDWPLSLILGSPGPLALRAEALGVATIALNFPSVVARLGDAGVGGPAGKQIGRLALAGRLAISVLPLALYVKRLRRTLAALGPDMIHTNGFKMHILGAWSAPKGVPVLWHIHDYVSKRPVMTRLLRRYSKRCFAAIANSKSVAADLNRVCAGRLRVHTVYNGVDLERFGPEGARLDLDQLSGMDAAEPGTVRVGLVATFARWKGHAVFLKALSLLPRRLKIRGYIIGDAIYATDGSQHTVADLRAMAEGLGVADRVGFTGFVADVPAAMRALDVVVHASTEPEPFGLVIAEAMACGRAVVASSAGGAAEVMSDGVDSLGHTPGDAEGLAARIEQLTDSRLRAELAAAGRTGAVARFERARMAGELIPIYRTFKAPISPSRR
jgi:glycosyltransferase involved in cell wall biosynthesis